jgi:hypothetical protein
MSIVVGTYASSTQQFFSPAFVFGTNTERNNTYNLQGTAFIHQSALSVSYSALLSPSQIVPTIASSCLVVCAMASGVCR